MNLISETHHSCERREYAFMVLRKYTVISPSEEREEEKEFEPKSINMRACVCVCVYPNAFWHRRKHIVDLPYVKDFDEKNIPTKARPVQMNAETIKICKKEINDLLQKKLIRNSKSPWSCAVFYVQKNAEIERGTPCLVINYKPLNKVLEWIRYPIPNKNYLVHKLSKTVVFSKFDMKFGF